MSTTKPARSLNIEVLRILAILGVLTLHYFNAEIGGGIKYAPEGSITTIYCTSLNRQQYAQ